jgi:hypothetical protein
MWKDFPKRQLICSYGYRRMFGSHNYVVIPYKNSKWGIVPEHDIQSVENIYQINGLNISDKSYSELVSDLEKNDILDYLVDMEPYKNGFKVSSYQDLNKNIQTCKYEISEYEISEFCFNEVWTDSNVLLIREDVFNLYFKFK